MIFFLNDIEFLIILVAEQVNWYLNLWTLEEQLHKLISLSLPVLMVV